MKLPSIILKTCDTYWNSNPTRQDTNLLSMVVSDGVLHVSTMEVIHTDAFRLSKAQTFQKRLLKKLEEAVVAHGVPVAGAKYVLPKEMTELVETDPGTATFIEAEVLV